MDVQDFIHKRLKLRHLHMLLALDETLSVSRTAEALNVAQASVSRSLAEIEEGLGLPLFERHSRGLRHTLPGRELLQEVRQIVGRIKSLEGLTQQFNELSRGDITIGVHNVSLLSQLARFVASFKEDFPRVNIKIKEGLLPDLLSDLRYGRLDMVFGRLRPDVGQDNFETFLVSEMRLAIAARIDMPAPPQPPAALLAQSWLLPLPETPMRVDFDQFCAKHGCSIPLDRIETNNVTLMVEILLRQDRYALFPAHIEEHPHHKSDLYSHPSLRIYDYPFKSEADRIGMIFSRSNAHPPAVAGFLKRLHDKKPAR